MCVFPLHTTNEVFVTELSNSSDVESMRQLQQINDP